MTYITGSVEEAYALSTGLTTDITFPEKKNLLGNETVLEKVIVSGEAVRVFANILDEELTKLLVRCVWLFFDIVVVGLELATGSDDGGRLASTHSETTIDGVGVRHFR